jgi:hypothetical protein
MKGIKKGALPYVVTPSFPPPTIMNLQTMARFSYLKILIYFGHFSHESFLLA